MSAHSLLHDKQYKKKKTNSILGEKTRTFHPRVRRKKFHFRNIVYYLDRKKIQFSQRVENEITLELRKNFETLLKCAVIRSDFFFRNQSTRGNSEVRRRFFRCEVEEQSVDESDDEVVVEG